MVSEARAALAAHWQEYLMEAAGLGAFMVSACFFATVLEHPGSPLHAALPHPLVRRALMGLCMGFTCVAIVYSPWGQQSGAHLNPAVTLTFLRLGKVKAGDAAFYAAAQFAGGALGVMAAGLLLGSALGHPSVGYVVTAPGARGPVVAFLAELLISFGLMFAVLNVSSRPRVAARTGWVAGALVMLYITFEAPLSGMSMNPARTLASALAAGHWMAIGIYFVAPPLGMLLAAEAFQRMTAPDSGYCAKLYHSTRRRCIFCPPSAAAAALVP